MNTNTSKEQDHIYIKHLESHKGELEDGSPDPSIVHHYYQFIEAMPSKMNGMLVSKIKVPNQGLCYFPVLLWKGEWVEGMDDELLEFYDGDMMMGPFHVDTTPEEALSFNKFVVVEIH